MKKKNIYQHLFLWLWNLLILLLISWGTYVVATGVYLDANPNVMNEYGVFAILGMMFYSLYHIVFLVWSMLLPRNLEQIEKPKYFQITFIILFGILPGLLVLIYSAMQAVFMVETCFR